MKIIVVDPNLMRTFFGSNFLILIMVRTLENNYFWCALIYDIYGNQFTTHSVNEISRKGSH